MAVNPFKIELKYSFKELELISSNNSSFFVLPVIKSCKFLYTFACTETFLQYLTESLPKKSNLIILSPSNMICSTLNDVTPTVSASSLVSFDPPTRNAKLSIKYKAVANCLDLKSSDTSCFS